jgi:hypothetical protein
LWGLKERRKTEVNRLPWSQYNTPRSHPLPDLFRGAMHEMLDAEEEIWLNIFQLNTRLVAPLDATFLTQEHPSAR